MIWLIAIILLCVVAEGFFSGSEIALVSVNRARLQHMSDSGSKSARALKAMLENPEILIGTTLLGTNISTVCANFAANEIFARTFGASLSWTSVFIMIPIILFFGEILPKAYYRKNSETTAYRVVALIKFFSVIFRPFLVILSAGGNVVRRVILGKDGDRAPYITRQEFKMLLEQERFSLEEDKLLRMLTNISGYLERTVGEVAIPMVHVSHCEPGDDFRKIADVFVSSGFSRLPVYDRRKDEITGMINDLYLLDNKNRRSKAREIAVPSCCIPENLEVSRALLTLREQQKEIATVIDEYGGTVGIVTLKDIVKEITGKISDADEWSHSGYVHALSDDTLLVDALFRLSKLQNLTGSKLDLLPMETINGLVSQLLGRVPKKGDSCMFENLEFHVLRARPQRAEMIKVIKQKPKEKEND